MPPENDPQQTSQTPVQDPNTARTQVDHGAYGNIPGIETPQNPPAAQNPPQEPASGPEPMRQVRIGGRLVELPASQADVVEAEAARLERERQAALSAMPLNQPQQGNTNVNTPPENARQPAPTPSFDFNEEEFWANPKAALDNMYQKVRQDVVQDVENRYRQVQGMRDFWNEFYDENPHLKKNKDIVDLVFNRDFRELGQLTVSEAKAELAKRAANRIMELRGANTESSSRRTVTEGGSTSRESSSGPSSIPSAQQTERTSNPGSLSGMLAERRRKQHSPPTG